MLWYCFTLLFIFLVKLGKLVISTRLDLKNTPLGLKLYTMKIISLHLNNEEIRVFKLESDKTFLMSVLQSSGKRCIPHRFINYMHNVVINLYNVNAGLNETTKNFVWTSSQINLPHAKGLVKSSIWSNLWHKSRKLTTLFFFITSETKPENYPGR